MALIGSVVNQGSMQGQINEANGNLTGLISSAELIGGQVVGMRGLKGDKGDPGDPGADGQDGADGYSPSASVVKVGDTATITITDSLGTTTANVSDGKNGAFVVHFTKGVYNYYSDKTSKQIYDAHADGLDVFGILELNDGVHVLALSLAHEDNPDYVCKFSVIESPYTSDNVHIDFVELTVDNNGVTDSGSYTKYVPPTTRKINNKNLASDITLTASDVGAQETLVSGTNIKTINNNSLLGSGNISVGGGGSSAFIAEYGVTTYADVKDAYDEDAIILCTVDDSGNTAICQLAYFDDANDLFYFAQPQSDGFYLAIIASDDTWDDSYFTFASTDTATQLRDGLMSALDWQKLDGIESGAEVNVQSDWNQSVNTADDYIKNKPTLFSGDYDDLTNKPTIPTNTSDLVNDSGFLTSESIFIAEKDVTTYAEITAALNAGKTVFAKTSNSYSTFNLYTYAFDNGTSYYFYRQDGGAQVNMLNVDNTDTWSSGSTSLVTTDKLIVHEHFILSSRSFPANAAYWFASNNIAVPTKTGYTAVGIVGASSNSNYILVNPLIYDSDPTKLYGFARNLHTSAVSTTIEFDVLYVRTDLL